MGISLKQLEIYKVNLENQLNYLRQKRIQTEKQTLMVQGVIMWISQRIDELREEKHDG